MSKNMKVMTGILAVILLGGAAMYFSNNIQFGQGAIRLNAASQVKNTTSSCPSTPQVIFEGEADINAGPRGSYGFTISSGDFEDIKKYVKKACDIRVVMLGNNSFGYQNTDVYDCTYALAYDSSFACHFGQTSQVVDRDNGNTGNETLADTYIEVSQIGNESYKLSTTGYKMDGSHLEGFTPHALLGNPDKNLFQVFVTR